MSDPIYSWLAAQRELAERWLLTSPDAARNDTGLTDNGHNGAGQFWQSISESASPQARELARQLMQLGPGFLAGAGDALFDLFGASNQKSANDSSFSRWLDLAPIGYFREHHAQAQELAHALDEYRRVAAQMSGAIVRIHAEALERLAAKTQELAAAGNSVTDTRRLYDLWIECGEQAFAREARGEAFGRLQGKLVNAGTRVRAAQQTIAESFLKSLDLPTRAELNSVHKRLKEMRDRIEQLEDRAAARSKRS
ncbi:MAG TPA: poly(R)-hydroxyalkanoic acid synthase subunit PhaE [Steroidobacteraceae bacterium]|nr:poly(R)-hydroxyalkanoic acid synthase subunit PhaE [Steroidobacteraceae bacterium]